MKRTTLLVTIMCIGACMIESSGIWFAVACAMVVLPAIVIAWKPVVELYRTLRSIKNVVYDENTCVDIATRTDMYEFV